jgi:hypothetical protein
VTTQYGDKDGRYDAERSPCDMLRGEIVFLQLMPRRGALLLRQRFFSPSRGTIALSPYEGSVAYE